MSYKSIKNRVHDLGLAQESFVPAGETSPITYYQLALQVRLNGEEREIRVKLSQDKHDVLLASEIINDDWTEGLQAGDEVTPAV